MPRFFDMGASPRGGLLGWLRAAVTGRVRRNELRGVRGAEFDRIARDLDLSPPELYGLLTGRRPSAEAPEKCLAAEIDASPQLAKRLRAIERKHRAARMRASLPIGPSCC